MKNATLKVALFLGFSISGALASAPAVDPLIAVLDSLQGSVARRESSYGQMREASAAGDEVAGFLAEPVAGDLEFDKKACCVIDLLRVLRGTSIPSEELLLAADGEQMPAGPINLADLLLHYDDEETPYCLLTSLTADSFDLRVRLATLNQHLQALGQDLEGRWGRNLSDLQQSSREFFKGFYDRSEKASAKYTAYYCHLESLYKQEPKPADYAARSAVLLACAKTAREDKELFEELGRLCDSCVKSAIHCSGYDDLEGSDSESSAEDDDVDTEAKTND